MSTQNRRFVFITFEDLKKVRFKKLEKVCDRLFIFINSKEDSIPFSLVQQIQKLGRSAKWVPIDLINENAIHYHLCFLMGKLHQKVHKSVEFAVLTNNASYDPLVAFINEKGRSCIRIKRKKSKKNKRAFKTAPIQEEIGYTESNPTEGHSPNIVHENSIEGELLNHTAKETIRRLIRSGNRPTEVDTLKRYIQLYNQELTEHDGNIDRIIGEMEESNDIQIQKGTVIYNF